MNLAPNVSTLDSRLEIKADGQAAASQNPERKRQLSLGANQ